MAPRLLPTRRELLLGCRGAVAVLVADASATHATAPARTGDASTPAADAAEPDHGPARTD